MDISHKNQNLDSWNKWVELNYHSDFYDVSTFLEGRSSLNKIEKEVLGEVTGKSILHVQCHFGQDSISLARMGAKVTGTDFSPEAIKTARELAEKTGQQVNFVEADTYDLETHLSDKYDIIFTSYGALPWLPDLDQWASIFSNLLKPGGRLVLVEFHPVVWMHDDDVTSIKFPYFNVQPIEETIEGNYAERESAVKSTFVTWNHSLSEVMTAMLNHGFNIRSFNEYDHSPYDFLPGMVEQKPGEFVIAKHGNKLPLVYSIEAIKHE